MRIPVVALLTITLFAACDKAPTGATAPAPAASRQLLLTYFTMPG